MMGTRKVRLGASSSACSATRRCTASRTGITLTPKASAVLRKEICSPGIIRPPINKVRNCLCTSRLMVLRCKGVTKLLMDMVMVGLKPTLKCDHKNLIRLGSFAPGLRCIL